MTSKINKSTGDTTKFTRSMENKLVKVETLWLAIEYVYNAF
jgi:hypothetical protein